MDKIKNLSLKKTFFLIVAATAVAVILLSAVSVRVCARIRDRILLSHAFIMQPAVIGPERGGGYIFEAGNGAADGEDEGFTDGEAAAFKAAQILIVLLPVAFSFAGIAGAGSLFYHIKLKEPLDALGQGIAHIADNDLSFSMGYQKQDEL